MPDAAYRFDPASKYKKLKIIGNDKLFLCDKHIQRLIFYSNSPWENWEQEHLDKFDAFLEQSGLQLPQGFREEEILRHLQAAQFNHKKAFDNILRQMEWRQANLPIKITNTVEQLIVR